MSIAKRRSEAEWQLLFDEWIKSGLPRVEFLAERGLNGRTGRTWQKTKHWDGLASHLPHATIVQNRGALADDGKVTVEADAAVAATTGGRRTVDKVAEPMPGDWRLIERWRARQAAEDWKTADSLRAHIKLILRGALKESKDEVTGDKVYRTALRPHEARQLAQAAAEVQRIQRLAIGLSTENVGVEQAGGTHVETVTANVVDEKPIPTYVVEMSGRGRFVRPKPRRVS